MAANIEIKARLPDFEQAVKAAEAISDTPREVIRQEDVFFHIAGGRLKLRILGIDRGELIFYERPDAPGPKASHYEIFRTSDPEGLQRVLSLALGVRGVVRKIRWLYFSGQTRIHLDQVEDLGEFLELEVVLRPEQPAEEGARIAEDLMEKLGVDQADLLQGAYIDMLEQHA